MISDKEFIRLSLESNLFFLRIVKEHNYFAAASLPPKGTPISMQLIAFNRTIEKLLSMTIALSYGNLSKEVLASGELVTKYTLSAEEETQFLTGIPIDTTLTKKETNFGYINYYQPSKTTFERVSRLNIQILKTVNYIVNFQKKYLMMFYHVNPLDIPTH